MAESRSLGDALTLSPEKMAFIQGGDSSTAPKPPAKRGRKPGLKTVELGSTRDETLHDESVLRAASPRPGRSRTEVTAPSAREVLDEVLVPLTTRLPHGMVQSLRRICLEQRLRHAKPDSIQEIVEVALGDWLGKRRP